MTLTARAKTGAVITVETIDAATVAPLPSGIAHDAEDDPGQDHDQQDDDEDGEH